MPLYFFATGLVGFPFHHAPRARHGTPQRLRLVPHGRFAERGRCPRAVRRASARGGALRGAILTTFTIEATFGKLVARLSVDRKRRDAEVVILFDRRIRRIDPVDYWRVETPEKAEAWFRRDSSRPELGSWMEAHAAMCARDPQWLQLEAH